MRRADPRAYEGVRAPARRADYRACQHRPDFEYIGLDEAVSRRVEITVVGSEGIVWRLAVANPLDARVLLYEDED